MRRAFRQGFGKRLALVGIAGLIALCLARLVQGDDFRASAEGQVVAEASNASETVYRIAENGCRIAWTVYRSPVNAGVVRHRAQCARPLAEQIPLIDKILSKILETEGETFAFRTLFMGTVGEMPGWSARLAASALQAPNWNRRTGRPKSGQINLRVLELAESAQLTRELNAVFASHQRSIGVSAIEKAQVAEAGTLPFFADLAKRGAKARDKLPYDCMIWLSVSP